ncbi:MAG: EAL domain-containing protein [Rhodospirillales bacterium]|nr:EAL domain-containing protein [Rhodospirillales bacterium]
MALITKDSEDELSPGLLRQDRDRFVAFAFSASDMLFELEGDGVIVFASGICESLFGVDPGALEGRNFLDLVCVDDRPLLRHALAEAKTGSRINGLSIRMEGKSGPTPSLSLSGYQLSDFEGHFFLGAHLGGPVATDLPTQNEPIMDADAFAARSGEVLANVGEDDTECKMTMIRLGQMHELLQRLDPDSAHRMHVAMGALLHETSVGGELVGEIDPENLSVVHDDKTDIDLLNDRLRSMIRQADPEGRGVEVESTTVNLASNSSDGDTQARALGYICTEFADSEPEAFATAARTDGLDTMMDDAIDRIGAFQAMVARGDFSVAFQPIVDLKAKTPHHYEALARFDDQANGKSPYETIRFAEKTGLIQEFDLAMCAKVIAWMDNAARQGKRYKVAVNLSGASINSQSFVDALNRLFAKHESLRSWVMFEITESSKIEDLQRVNKTIQNFRQVGHKVCLDDFGAGAAAFQYIRDLEVDLVKIDGAYVKGALRTAKSRAFLKAMASLCKDLRINTVAEMVEDEALLSYLQECRVSYGQGYLFGRPSFDIDVFEASPSFTGNNFR